MGIAPLHPRLGDSRWKGSTGMTEDVFAGVSIRYFITDAMRCWMSMSCAKLCLSSDAYNDVNAALAEVRGRRRVG